MMRALVAILLTILCSIGCKPKPIAKEAVAVERELQQVEVEDVRSESTIDYREFTGRTSAVTTIEIRARVSGYLVQSPTSKLITDRARPANNSPGDSKDSVSFVVEVSEGGRVSKGNPLFEIDPSPYKAILAQATGNLIARQAQFTRLELELIRNRELVRTNSVSESDLDLAIANSAETAGQIENLKAVVSQAELNLEFTRISSPIDGLLGQTFVTNGNLVTGDATILTTVVSTSPIQAYFDVDEGTVLDYRERVRDGKVPSARGSSIEVKLGLANELDYPHVGNIDFVDNATDGSTGNTRMRALFLNEEGALSPGLFARISAPISAEYMATIVQSRALGMDQKGRYVMVVDQDDTVHRRTIQMGTIRGDRATIAQGLKVGEAIVVAGLQKIKDGDKVRRNPPKSPEPKSDLKRDSSTDQPKSAPKVSADES